MIQFISKNKTIFILVMVLLLTSCTNNSAELMEKTSRRINDVGDFFSVYLMLQVSIFVSSIILGFILGRLGFYIAWIAHLIWIIAYRDYGFFIVLLLFSLNGIVGFFIDLLFDKVRNKS